MRLQKVFMKLHPKKISKKEKNTINSRAIFKRRKRTITNVCVRKGWIREKSRD